MTNLKVTTESGRVYEIDREEGFWRRLPKPGEYVEGPQKIWSLKSGDVLAFPWDDPTDSFVDVEVPLVGKNLFIGSRDIWWTSTRVVSVEETGEDFFH